MAMGQIIEYAKGRRIPHASFSLSTDARAMVALQLARIIRRKALTRYKKFLMVFP